MVYSLQEQLRWAWLVRVGYNLLFIRQASYSLMNLILSFKSILDSPVETRNNEIISEIILNAKTCQSEFYIQRKHP